MARGMAHACVAMSVASWFRESITSRYGHGDARSNSQTRSKRRRPRPLLPKLWLQPSWAIGRSAALPGVWPREPHDRPSGSGQADSQSPSATRKRGSDVRRVRGDVAFVGWPASCRHVQPEADAPTARRLDIRWRLRGRLGRLLRAGHGSFSAILCEQPAMAFCDTLVQRGRMFDCRCWYGCDRCGYMESRHRQRHLASGFHSGLLVEGRRSSSVSCPNPLAVPCRQAIDSPATARDRREVRARTSEQERMIAGNKNRSPVGRVIDPALG